MDKNRTAASGTAYDDFLARLDKQMREALGMEPQPSDVDESRAAPRGEKPNTSPIASRA